MNFSSYVRSREILLSKKLGTNINVDLYKYSGVCYNERCYNEVGGKLSADAAPACVWRVGPSGFE